MNASLQADQILLSLEELILPFRQDLEKQSCPFEFGQDLSKIFIEKITLDSRTSGPGSLFCAMKGIGQDGHDFIPDAISRGCSAILCERKPTSPLTLEGATLEKFLPPIFIFPSLKEKIEALTQRLFPLKPNLCLIGVTGTNGKTSVTHFIAQALTKLNLPCGIIGSLSGSLTTPDRFELGRQLSLLPETVAIEVSSHALDQNRLADLPFKIGVFTNLSHDHLDYHQTLDAYAEAKSQLFKRPELNSAVINLEDARADFFIRAFKSAHPDRSCLTYSLSQKTADIHLSHPPSLNNKHAFELTIQTPLGRFNTTLALWGEFNISNILAALGALIQMGYSKESLQKTLPYLTPPKGRMERITLPNQSIVIIDYAHTPDAFEKVLATLKKYTHKKSLSLSKQLICVFGCGGDRDRTKRPKMAAIAEKYASFIIVTGDNSRFENPEQIFQDIISGFSQELNQDSNKKLKKSNNYKIIPSRELAIKTALQLASSGDVILLAGKGHETYLDIEGKKIPFDERDFLPSFRS